MKFVVIRHFVIFVFVSTLYRLSYGLSPPVSGDPGEYDGDSAASAGTSSSTDRKFLIDIRMPGVRSGKEDEYICFGWKVPHGDNYIVKYEPLSDAAIVHHILVFGCQDADISTYQRECYAACKDGDETIMYAWAQNAPPLELPKDVGFRIGARSKVNYIVIQVHYRMPMNDDVPEDHSGVRLTITPTRQPYIGGIYLLLVNDLKIPAHAVGVHGDAACMYNGKENIYPFAFRTHAHALGRVLTGYHINDSWHEIAKGNPHWPQAFYSMSSHVVVKKGDYLVARCTYDAINKSVDTNIGSTHNDEMCNLYVMYYTVNGAPSYHICVGIQVPDLAQSMPSDSDVALPPNPLFDDVALGRVHKGIELVPGWPQIKSTDNVKLGQISGIAVSSDGHVHIFHRDGREWTEGSFSIDDKFQHIRDGPLRGSTLIELEPVLGTVIYQWGANIFYMPHGLHICQQGNFWMTDVAMHQVFKFQKGATKPDLVLGVEFEPGSDSRHFCKPTDVAVLSTGEFFVADGYCNNRIMKFSGDGKFLMHWGKASDTSFGAPLPSTFAIPHSITVDEQHKLVCVADRENGRIQCFDFTGRFVRLFQHIQLSPTTYAVTYCHRTGYLYAVNGPGSEDPASAVLASIIDPTTGYLIDTWQPNSLGFVRPHDIATSPDGHYLYVSEIGPNRIWQFVNYNNLSNRHQSVKKVGAEIHLSTDTSTDQTLVNRIESDVKQPSVTLVAAAALIILLLVVIVLIGACILQCKRRTGYSHAHLGDDFHVPKMHGPTFKPFRARVYKDNPDSEDSEVEEFVAVNGGATPLSKLRKSEPEQL